MSLFRRFTPLFLLTLLVSAPVSGRAQNTHPDDNWVPQGMDALGNHASFHTNFTFDKQMLDLASGITSDEQTQRIVAKLRGISVHVYRYPEPGLYEPRAVDAVRMQYRDRGWKHLVTTQAHAASANPGRTDVWVRFENSNVEGMVLLMTNPTNVDLVAVNGTLSPLDLLHLRGHFGIPRFSGDGFVGDNGDRVAPNQPLNP